MRNTFTPLWHGTIWGGRPNHLKSTAWKTLWGCVTHGGNNTGKKRQTLPPFRRSGDEVFQTIWGTIGTAKSGIQKFVQRSLVGKTAQVTQMTHMLSIWGWLSLWDGREESYWPGDGPERWERYNEWLMAKDRLLRGVKRDRKKRRTKEEMRHGQEP